MGRLNGNDDLKDTTQLVFVPPSFDIYRAVSRHLHRSPPLLEPLSFDEAYLDVT